MTGQDPLKPEITSEIMLIMQEAGALVDRYMQELEKIGQQAIAEYRVTIINHYMMIFVWDKDIQSTVVAIYDFDLSPEPVLIVGKNKYHPRVPGYDAVYWLGVVSGGSKKFQYKLSAFTSRERIKGLIRRPRATETIFNEKGSYTPNNIAGSSLIREMGYGLMMTRAYFHINNKEIPKLLVCDSLDGPEISLENNVYDGLYLVIKFPNFYSWGSEVTVMSNGSKVAVTPSKVLNKEVTFEDVLPFVRVALKTLSEKYHVDQKVD